MRGPIELLFFKVINQIKIHINRLESNFSVIVNYK